MRLFKFSKETVVQYIDTRNLREKMLIVVFVFFGVLFLDYWVWLGPVFRLLSQSAPRLESAKHEYQGLLDDKKNKEKIKQSWLETKSKLEATEKGFVGANEIPLLLENLSKLAFRSDVKILSLNPTDKAALTAQSLYTPIEVKINALAGTHEFGKFLSQLEGGPTFFKVTDLKISENSLDNKRHLMTVTAEVYKK